jgi:divinyl chlorophyllide a 8-vinyl-reductase
VTAFVRGAEDGGRWSAEETRARLPGAELRFGELSPTSLSQEGFRGERFDVLVSCLASRSGAPSDAWKVDHEANSQALACAREAGVRHVVLVSAICVQKPRLAFQRAKLAFEAELMASGMSYAIVRPTAYFKSLSGQIERVRDGKPFLLFGDGTGTACKPISNHDLAEFVLRCIEDESLHNRILPIGGPGPAITPREQGLELFRLTGREPKFRKVPVWLFGALGSVLGTAGRIAPGLADKAEFVRTARYYATESMLVWDDDRGRYDAEATPSFGSDTLFQHYRDVIGGKTQADPLGEHAVFARDER